MLTARHSRRVHWDLHLFNNQKIQFAEWEMRHMLAKESVEFIDAQMTLELHTDPYEDLIRAFKSRPIPLAHCLYQYHLANAQSTDSKIDMLLRVVLFTIHGNFFFPEEEQAVMTIMWELVRLQIEDHKDRAELFLRSSSAFTRFFMLYSKEYSFKGYTFLVSSLRDPVLEVLANDDMDLDFEPLQAWNRLSETQRENMFGREYQNVESTADLVANPNFMKHLHAVFDRLVSLCTRVIDGMTDACSTMPYSLRWIGKRLTEELKKAGLTAQEIWTALGNVFLLRFITPAIASPEPVGILVDTPISPTARRNLGLISRTLRDINRGAFNLETEQPEAYMLPLYDKLQKVGTVKLRGFLEKMTSFKGDASALSYPPYTVNHRGRRRVIGIAPAELRLLHEMLESLDIPDSHVFAGVLQNLPEDPKVLNPEDATVMVVGLGQDATIGGLLTESEVCKQIAKYAAASGSGADATEEDPAAAEAVEKLRACLSEVGFSMQWRHLDFLEVLEAELNEACALGNQHAQAQLQACLRCIRKLPKAWLADNAKLLHDAVKRDFHRHQPYVSYLVSTLESLSITKELLNRHIESLDYSTSICTKYFNSTRVRRFLDQHMAGVREFEENFKQIEMLDEKSAFLADFLEKMHDEMASDPTWAEASPEELEDSRLQMEKRFLTHIYNFVFFPHELSHMNDQLFQAHIRDDLSHLSADHECLQIQEHCRAEMPWPTAQKTLLRMNSYKTPSDKLQSIVECCTTLMELLQLNGKSAGADDFFPLLVFVILKANPPNLLATIQYINFFGGSAINSGEGSYWFAQFQTAVTFIQSIDDRDLQNHA